MEANYFFFARSPHIFVSLVTGLYCIYAGGIHHAHVAFRWQRGRKTYSFSGKMASRDLPRFLVELLQVLRESPNGAALRDGFANATQATVLPRPRDLFADFSDADKYLSIFRGALEFVLLPHAHCPQHATSFDIRNRMQAWGWVVSEIRTHAGDSNWLHADSLGSFADIFSNAFTLIGNCCCLLYIRGSIAQEWFDSPKLIHEQRVARYGWPFRVPALRLPMCASPFPFFARLCSAITLTPVAVIFGRAPSPPFPPAMCGGMNATWWIPRMMKIFLWRCEASTLTRRSIFRPHCMLGSALDNPIRQAPRRSPVRGASIKDNERGRNRRNLTWMRAPWMLGLPWRAEHLALLLTPLRGRTSLCKDSLR